MIREGMPIINLIPFHKTIIQVYLYLTGNISVLYILKNILLYFIFLIPTGNTWSGLKNNATFYLTVYTGEGDGGKTVEGSGTVSNFGGEV